MSLDPKTARVAVITGASSGIGEATARALAAHGHRLALLARRVDRIHALADEPGNGSLAIKADVTDRDSIVAAAERVKSELGGADILVNNAGVMLLAPFSSEQRAEIREMVETNLLGAMTVTEVFLDQLRDRAGDLVNRRPGPGESRDLRHLPLREEPISDPPLIENLDRARVQTTCARAGDVLAGAPLDNRNVDPRQRQLARQHQPRRTAPGDHHRMFGQTPPPSRRFWFRPEILRHDPGLAGSPPVPDTLRTVRSANSSLTLSAADGHGVDPKSPCNRHSLRRV